MEAEELVPEGEVEENNESPPEEETPEAHWYVLHTYSGYENKAKTNLEHRIESMALEDQVFEVLVPTEEEMEIRGGQRRTVKRNIFPGYVLVRMFLTDESWLAVRHTPGVTGFVGMGSVPTPLPQEEVDEITQRMEAEAPILKVSFRPGQVVRITDGPFADFVGSVDSMDLEKGKLRVLVSFFGRETPVELDFIQVERV
jgi:transcriptional antiterminator NusG